jgi:site-specific recombinase XerD
VLRTRHWRLLRRQGALGAARGPFTRDGFNKMLKAAADRARIKNVHPPPCATPVHALAMKSRDMRLVQEYMGHTNVQNAARYMDGVSARFRGIWD